MASDAAIGIDIGGTSIRAGLVDREGRILATAKSPTPAGGEPRALAEALRKLAAEVTPLRGEHAIGVALPGLRDESDTLVRAVNLPKLEGTALPAFFKSCLGRDVRIETDVIAAGLAQWRCAAEKDGARAARLLYLSLGTGVGGCVLIDGRPLRHTHGGAGSLGHVVVDTADDAPRCRCGGQGCLEALAGGWALEEHATPEARRLIALRTAITNFAALFAPTLILLGGGVIERRRTWIDAVRALFTAPSQVLGDPIPMIEPAPLPADDAGVIGAAWEGRSQK
ncbi:N-acetyl-D-glucosamine kinase [Phycisphaerae bacterium RAS1]|nr:N-acetyl-D-glucosamine kinase [Phycisphaerae bacterium RAS1]